MLENNPVNQAKIQKLNQCSIKTVKDDLLYLKEAWSHVFDFAYDSDFAHSINSNIDDLMVLKQKLFQNEVKIQLLLSIFINPNLTMPEHAAKISYSQSHLRRQIKPLNNYLQDFNSQITLNYDTRGYIVESTNEVLTSFMFSQVIKSSDNKILLPPLNKLSFQAINDALNNPFTFVPDEEKQDMDTFFQVLNLRSDQGFNCEDSIRDLRKTHQTLLDKHHVFEKAIDTYSQQFNKVLSVEERSIVKDIFISIALKTKLAPKEIDNFMNRFSYFYASLKKVNQPMAHMFELIVEEINEKHQLNYSNYLPELAFFFYTHITGLRSFKSLNIGVLSFFGKWHENSLIISLIKHFPAHTFNHYREHDDFDLVISTHNTVKASHKSKTIKVSDYLTLKDIDKIYNRIYIDIQ